jgi:hypothetical protein
MLERLHRVMPQMWLVQTKSEEGAVSFEHNERETHEISYGWKT